MTLITIGSTTISGYNGTGNPTLKILADQDFRTSSGVNIQRNYIRDGIFYKTVNCTASGGVVTVPSYTLDSTTDSSVPNGTYTAILYDSRGKRIRAFFSGYRIPTIFGTSVAWSNIATYNGQPPTPFQFSYPTVEDVQAMIDDAVLDGIDLSGYATTADLTNGLSGKQDTLVSATNIKTINGNSILGSGNVTISGSVVETEITNASDLDSLVTTANSNTSNTYHAVMSASITISSAVTIPENVFIKSLNGSRLTKSGSGAITFMGVGLTEPESTIPLFSGFSVGDITFAGLSWPQRLSIELWDTADDSLNKRINLADAAVSTKAKTFASANTLNDTISITSHGFLTGMAVVPSGTLPTTSPTDYLYADTPVYVIKVDDNTIKLAYTYDNAIKGTAINLTSTGSGTLTKYTPCTLICYPRTITNPGSVIQEFHTLLFKGGHYQSEFDTFSTTHYAPFMLKDNTTMTAEGHAILHESPVDGNGYMVQAWTMSWDAPSGSAANICKNIVVEKLHFLGNPNQIETSNANSAILLGNCWNGFVRHCTFERLKAYATGIGGIGQGGNYAKHSGIHDNMYIGCEAQQAFMINAESCFISRNYFDCLGGSGGLAIDIEPNSYFDHMDNITVEDNVIDCTRAVGSFGGIAFQAAGGTSALNGAICRNNTILGRDLSETSGYGSLSAGIGFIGVSNGVFDGNFIRAASGTGAYLWGCANVMMSGNYFLHCNGVSGHGESFQLLYTSDTYVKGNVNAQAHGVPHAASMAIWETENQFPATSSGSIISADPIGAYRFFSHHKGLDVYFNGSTYTISSLDTSLNPMVLTMATSVGTVAVKTASTAGVNTSTDRITITAHGYNDGCILQYTGNMGGLTSGASYYVVNKTANDFQLASTQGGTAIDLTSVGTGTHTFTPMVETRFSSNTYDDNRANGYILASTGTSQIVSTALDRYITTVVDANHTATTASGMIVYTSLTASRTVALPDATICKGKEITVKDGAGAAGTFNIVLDGSGTQTIDGASTKSITTNHASLRVKSNGSNWITV